MANKFEIARRKYKPEEIKYLLIAEAPPDENSDRFFYFEDVKEKDSLFLETMKVLYPGDYTDPKTVRKKKKQFLNKFKENGFYLIDSTNQPMPDLKRHHKIKLIKASLATLIKKVKNLVNEDTKIILIASTVYEVCNEPLRNENINVINEEMINFPGTGGQRKFREKMTRLLERHS